MRRLSLLTLAGLAAMLGACSSGDQAVTASGKRPNVLLITVDTLRRDHLQPYGYQRPTSPNLARFAETATVFDDAQAPAPWTLPSLASLLTGLPASAHGCRTFYDSLAPSYQALPEQLLAHGYDTAAVTSHVFLGRPYGLHQGFVHFDDELVLEMTRSDEVVSSPAVSDKGIAFLQAKAEAEDSGPWMLWLHYFDPHAVYQPHAEYAAKFGSKRPIDRYDGEIAFTDQHIGRVLDALDATGLAEDTIVLLTADHGEEFGDHGGVDHGHTLYRELLDVPLILRAPGFEARRVEDLVRLTDVSATLLELCGVPALPESLGASLVPMMRGESIDLPPSLAELDRNPRLSKAGLVRGDTKYVLDRQTGRVELFDRGADRAEHQDVAGARADELHALAAELEALVAQAQAIAEQHPDAFRLDLGADDMGDLAGTGYVGDE